MHYNLKRNLPMIPYWKKAAYYYCWRPEFEFLPEHYKKRVIEYQSSDSPPVHFKLNPETVRWNYFTQRREPIRNVPVRVEYPKECNEGLWGGEGVIRGFLKPDKFRKRRPKLWFPNLQKTAVYSEILDEWFNITVTCRALHLIDEAFGLDHYILGTPEREINSELGMKLRRKMLVALAAKTIYPDDPTKKKQILQKYKKYTIPYEEAQWVGLSVSEAVAKWRAKKDKEWEELPPLKDLFIEEQVKKRLSMQEELVEKDTSINWKFWQRKDNDKTA